jgi:hypothetical protein
MKQKIRLTEGDLHRIINKCVNEALNEGSAMNLPPMSTWSERAQITAKLLDAKELIGEVGTYLNKNGRTTKTWLKNYWKVLDDIDWLYNNTPTDRQLESEKAHGEWKKSFYKRHIK